MQLPNIDIFGFFSKLSSLKSPKLSTVTMATGNYFLYWTFLMR